MYGSHQTLAVILLSFFGLTPLSSSSSPLLPFYMVSERGYRGESCLATPSLAPPDPATSPCCNALRRRPAKLTCDAEVCLATPRLASLDPATPPCCNAGRRRPAALPPTRRSPCPGDPSPFHVTLHFPEIRLPSTRSVCVPSSAVYPDDRRLLDLRLETTTCCPDCVLICVLISVAFLVRPEFRLDDLLPRRSTSCRLLP